MKLDKRKDKVGRATGGTNGAHMMGEFNKMKKVKNKFYKTANVIIFGLLALLGFTISSCAPGVEYGTPSAKFIMNGRENSEVLITPVKNIRAEMVVGVKKKHQESLM